MITFGLDFDVENTEPNYWLGLGTRSINLYDYLSNETNKKRINHKIHDINSLDENKKTKANILIDFGINDYHPRFIDFLDLEENYIIDLIENQVTLICLIIILY